MTYKYCIDYFIIKLTLVSRYIWKYIIYGDTSIQDKHHLHHILHCENIECFSNVKIIKNNGLEMKDLRDNGSIKKIIDDCLTSLDI